MVSDVHQAEAANLLRSATSAIEDRSDESRDNQNFRRFASTITAVGSGVAAMTYFGARYFQGFWTAGSRSRQPEWLHDLTADEREIAAALGRIAQEPPAAAPLSNPATKANSLLAALQLVTGVTEQAQPLVSASGSSLPPNLATQAALPVPAENLRPSTIAPMPGSGEQGIRESLATATQPDPWDILIADSYDDCGVGTIVRKRKHIEGVEEISNANLAEGLDAAMAKGGFSIVRRELLQLSLERYMDDQKPVFAMHKLIKELIGDLQKIARIVTPDDTERYDYHVIYGILRLLWTFSEVFRDDASLAEFKYFKQNLLRERWLERDRNIVPSPTSAQDEDKIVADYLHSRSDEWRQQQLSGSDKVVFHNRDEARMFSIGQVLKQEHLSFIDSSESGMYFHLQYDNTGLRDDDLIKLVRSAANLQLFTNFKQAPRYQPEGYYQLAAKKLVELHLMQMSATPLNFEYRVAIERAMERAALKFLDGNGMIDRATKETIVQMDRLSTDKPVTSLIQKLVLAYACGYMLAGRDEVFGELEKQAVLDSDYVYRYQDGSGKTRAGITTLDVYLSRNAEELDSDIGTQDNVNLLLPVEFSPALIDYINGGTAMVDRFAKRVATEVRIIELEHELMQALPSLSFRLAQYVAEIGSVYGIEDCNLFDEIEFTYKHIIKIPYVVDPVFEDRRQVFNIRQIVLGVERNWKQNESRLSERHISRLPDNIPSERRADYERYIRSLLVFNAQDRLTMRFNELTQDLRVKTLFMEYVDAVAGDFKSEGQSWYEFSETPLLLIFPDRKPTRQEWEAGRQRSNPYFSPLPNAWLKEAEIPIVMISLLTKKMHYFASYAEMTERLRENTFLAAHVKAHFPVGYTDGFSNPELSEITTADDQYERRINWDLQNVDRIIKSASETTSFTVLEQLSNIGFTVGEFMAIRFPAMGFIVSGASIIISKVLQATFISTRPDEQKKLLKAAMLDLIEEMAGKMIEQLGGKRAEELGDKMSLGIDEYTKQHADWIVERFFMNTTVDWK